MKTIKLLFAVCLLFACTHTFAQTDEKKLTKEETIQWLKEKMELYFDNQIDLRMEINECSMTFYYTQKDEFHYKKSYRYKAVFPTNIDILKKFAPRGVSQWTLYYSKGTEAQRTDLDEGKTVSISSFYGFLKANTSYETAKSIESAIMHLATFCTK